jgi:predicted nucleotide-binding protein
MFSAVTRSPQGGLGRRGSSVDNLIDELVVIERRCRRGAALLEEDAIKQVLQSISDAVDSLDKSWSGSWFGYQSCVYYANCQPRPPGATFSIEWGLSGTDFLMNASKGDWHEYPFEAVCDEVLRRAGNPDLDALEKLGAKVSSICEECQQELLATLDAILAETVDKRLQELRDEAAKIKLFTSASDLASAEVPKGRYILRDPRGLNGQIRTPPHIAVKARALEVFSRGFAIDQVGKVAKQVRIYTEKRMNLKGKSMARTEGTVFIGHGGSSQVWRVLKDLIQDRLGLKADEFNMAPAAGLTTKERLEEMLNSAVFAFLIMTAEDEQADKTLRARENVVHEAGLFQGRLGFKRAIIMLEEGCSRFSNIDGLTYIPFPKGNIKAASEDVRHVLEREGILPGK